MPTPAPPINYQLLVESLRDVVWVLDVVSRRFIYVSPSVRELVGHTAAEVMAQPMEMAVPPPHRAALLELLEQRVRAFEAGQIPDDNRFVEDMELLRQDGSTVMVEVAAHYLRDADTGRLQVYGVARDITERRRAEEAIRMSDVRHRLLAEYANAVVWTMDMDGSITYVSPTVERIRGYTPEEAMRQSIDEILTPASQAESIGYFTGMLQAIAEGRQPPGYRGQQEYLHKNGGTVWCEVIAFPLQGSDGRYVELLGISRDIHLRKQQEEEVRKAHAETARANEALRHLNEELERLAQRARQQAEQERLLREEQEKLFAMLAHELKTPLATVRMVAASIPRENGHEIARAVRDMNEVIERCVHSGQLSDRRLLPRHARHDLSALVGLAIQSGRWPHRVDWTAPTEPTPLESDAQMVRMIADNLIDNAAKYSPPDSRIPVEVQAEARNGQPGYTVRVTNLPGDAGWPDPALVFDKYYRAPHAQRQIGAGLGLFLVAGLARLLGGRIDYRPSDTHIRFECWLPQQPPAAGPVA